jgi:hypothetical protein
MFLREMGARRESEEARASPLTSTMGPVYESENGESQAIDFYHGLLLC